MQGVGKEGDKIDQKLEPSYLWALFCHGANLTLGQEPNLIIVKLSSICKAERVTNRKVLLCQYKQVITSQKAYKNTQTSVEIEVAGGGTQ